MDDQRFDSIARKLASSTSRRAALKGLLGIGGVAVAGLAGSGQTDAARRGFSGPSFSLTPTPICVANGNTCPEDPADPSQCCSGYCCKFIHDPGPGVCCVPPPP
jgi:hypothetical protein